MSIPASDIVSGNPSVVGTGGNALALAGVMMSKNTLVPTNTVLSFGSADTVKSYFGAASAEYAQAQIYFNGFDNKTTTPGLMWIAPYNDADRAAYLRSGDLSSLTLAELQALSGTIILTVDGVVKTSSTINLAAATSYSNAATLIEAGFTSGPDVTWDSINSTFVFTSTTSGVASTITRATGTLSTALALTSATGSVLSQGADADTPATAMDTVKAKTQNWVTFWTLWEPDIDGKTDFAVWANAQSQRYQYIAWDTDAQACIANSATAFGALAKAAAYNGVICISGDASDADDQGYTLAELCLNVASFYAGTVASTDFARTNGRITQAFKTQSGLLATVVNKTSADALLGNGYNFYGTYATANDAFTWFYDGRVPGKWLHSAPYINQIWLNNALQLADMTLLGQVNSIAYNAAGYSLIRAAMQDPIEQAVNAGVIRRGVVLSNQQKSVVNSAAGADIANEIYTKGYYLQILDPGAQVRGVGGSPVINFWYTDGGDVLKISFASVAIL